MKSALPCLIGLVFSATIAHAKDREITVSGTCTREVTTDRGSVIVTSVALESQVKDAVSQATRKYERALESIKKLKLENADLRTVEYSVNERRDWENNKSVFKGYQARIGLKVSTSDVQRLGEVTAIAAREEIQDVGSLSTYLSEAKLLEEQTACLKDAAEHARRKAERLAGSLSAQLGEVVSVSESGITNPPPPRPFHYAAAMVRASNEDQAAPSVESGEQQVTANVQVTFSLK